MRFADRRDAGRRLAAELLRYRGERPVVLALLRGGVPVGFEIAVALGAPLEVVLVRKIGAPGQPELGVGAVADGDDPRGVFNQDLVRTLGVSEAYLDRELGRQLEEIRLRQERYRKGRPAPEIRGRTAIVVDDGVATGGSMLAALRSVRRAHPARLVLAVPVAPPDTLESLQSEVDDIVCLSAPDDFGAVGRFYDDFTQTTDEEVLQLLEAARGERAGS